MDTVAPAKAPIPFGSKPLAPIPFGSKPIVAATSAPAPSTSSLGDMALSAGKTALNIVNENPIAKGIRSLAALPFQGLAKVLGQSDPFQKGIGRAAPPLASSVTNADQPAGKFAEEELGNAATVGSLFVPAARISSAISPALSIFGRFAPAVARIGTQTALGAVQGLAGGMQEGQDTEQLKKSAGMGAVLGGGLATAGELGSALIESLSSNTAASRLTDQKNNLKTLQNSFADTSTKTTNPIKTLDENELIKNLRVTDGKINIEGLTNPSSNGALDSLIEEQSKAGTQAVSQMKGSIPTSSFKNTVIESIKSSPSLKASGNISKVMTEVGRRFDDYTASYGDTIPWKDVDSIRTAMNKEWNPETVDAARAIGSTARALLYNDTGAGQALKSAMANEQELINAKDFVKKLGGTAVKGGRLGKYFADTIGAGVGGTIGGTVGGPFGIAAGAAVGGKATDAAMDISQKRYFNPILAKPAQAVAKAMPALEHSKQLGQALAIPFLSKK